MKEQITAKGKIQQICDVLKKETIEPAKQEASEIIENAHLQAQEIVKNAQKQAAELLEKAKITREEEEKTFTSSLHLAMKQTLNSLKQSIENELFNKELTTLLEKPMMDAKIMAEWINIVVQAIEKEGIDVDLSAYVGKKIPTKHVTELLAQNTLKRLREDEVKAGDFEAGLKIRLHEKQMTVEITMDSLKDLFSQFLRKDYREMVFNT